MENCNNKIGCVPGDEYIIGAEEADELAKKGYVMTW